MEKLLNDLGKEILILRKEYIEGKISDTVFSIVFSKYNKKIVDLVIDKSLSDKDFTDKLKTFSECLLSEAESLELIKSNLVEQYEFELSKTNDKFQIELNKNILTLKKHCRISQTYYKNFLGVDLEDLRSKANKSKSYRSYTYPKKVTFEEETYKKAYEQFEMFQKARLTNVLNELVEVINENKLIPAYKRYTEKPLSITKEYKDKVATIKLNINLDLKDDFYKNIKTMKNFLDLIDIEIEKRLNYSLYK